MPAVFFSKSFGQGIVEDLGATVSATLVQRSVALVAAASHALVHRGVAPVAAASSTLFHRIVALVAVASSAGLFLGFLVGGPCLDRQSLLRWR